MFTQTCAQIVALFKITKKWKQLKCSLIEEQINKVCVSAVEYYSGIKSNEELLHATAWINLGNCMLCEKSQTQKSYIV